MSIDPLTFSVVLTLVAVVSRILEFYETPTNVIYRELDVRSEHYGVLRGEARPDMKLGALRHLGIHGALDLLEVEESSAAVGESPTSLQLRSMTGAVVVTVVRDGKAFYRQDPVFQFQPGDTVVLVGDAEALERGSALFRPSTPGDDSYSTGPR